MNSGNNDRAKNSILDFLLHRLDAENVKTLDPETNLVAQQVIDSMGFLDLLSHLEDKFDVEVDLAPYDPQQYTTISGLARIIGEIIN